jgi:phosphoribosylamine--glycine ligase
MQRHGIPTPRYASFTDYKEAIAYLDRLTTGRVVVKVSGLGKMGLGVTVCESRAQAKTAVRTYMLDRILGEAASTVIIEERLQGVEASMFAVTDGRNVVPLLPVRDHKRIFDADTGPNTGGMGAFAPPPDCDEVLVEEVMETIMRPTVAGMAAEGHPYVGVLFAGLMLTPQGVQVLEFNCRFGNPEALVLMALLESDLVEVMQACLDGRLQPDHIQLRPGAAAAVMMSSPQYPAAVFPLGLPISGIRAAKNLAGVEVFHHGTAIHDEQLVTSRGRVLAVTAVADDLPTALRRAYEGVEKISFEGAHYRRDIGQQWIGNGQVRQMPLLAQAV